MQKTYYILVMGSVNYGMTSGVTYGMTGGVTTSIGTSNHP